MIKTLKIGLACGLLFVLSATGVAQADVQRFYFEGFNELNVNQDLNGQAGWTAIPDAVKVTNPPGFPPSVVGGGFTSRGPTFGYNIMATTRQFGTFPANPGVDFAVLLAIGMDDDRVSWCITPKSVTQESLTTQVCFREGGTLEILVPDGFGGSGFEVVPDFTWEPNKLYRVTIILNKSGLLQVGINSLTEFVWEGPAFTDGIELISFDCENERIGNQMFLDDIRVYVRNDK